MLENSNQKSYREVRGKKKQGSWKKCSQRIGLINKTKEIRAAFMRTGTNLVLRMGVVPGRV